ncbi:KxYKxGKxW signal peptide domain-containing protein, partial [Streptococcus suis]|uniref:KxYKxGKxW signal peptide domain-containing protein n=1 Tax=Streptococcus suis TaxID=1307 RepID=UPI002AA48198|nr:KxYKxGKxW signal peptide domain-containing protein [Streptococcus suis]
MSNNFSKIQGRFRMWKSGKRWLYAGAIVILASVGLAVGGNKILGPNGNANEQRLSMVDIGDSKRNLPTSDSVEPYLSDLSGNNDNRQISGESGERYLSGLSGNNSGHRLLGASGEGHVTLEKLPDISKEGLHIPELPQHSPELGGSNRTPLPGLEGDNHTGDSGLSDRNHTPLPGLEGEGHVTLEKLPDISKEGLHIPELPQHSPELGGSNRTPLPGLEGDNHTGDSGLSGRNHTPLPDLEGEGHVTLEKLPDISKEGLHIPELPQHSPEL